MKKTNKELPTKKELIHKFVTLRENSIVTNQVQTNGLMVGMKIYKYGTIRTIIERGRTRIHKHFYIKWSWFEPDNYNGCYNKTERILPGKEEIFTVLSI